MQAKDDEMILPRGITGFGSINTNPPLFLDEKAFRRMCHALARENGGAVTEVDTDTAVRNFYSAKLSRYDQSVFLLQNIHYSDPIRTLRMVGVPGFELEIVIFLM